MHFVVSSRLSRLDAMRRIEVRADRLKIDAETYRRMEHQAGVDLCFYG
jgi:hypothetical protein